MSTKQTIVIIGTGEEGKAIAAGLANGNFHLLICDKDYTKAAALVKELKDTGKLCDIEAMECSFDSAWEADIIILSMHCHEQTEVAVIIKEVINQKILISIVHPDGEINGCPLTPDGQKEALQALLPNTKIITISNGPMIGQPVFSEKNTGVLISGNNDKAIEVVSLILKSAGLYPKTV